MKKIYTHSGKGHYIGSTVVVISECREDAEKIIRELLDASGLKDEPLDIEESKITKDMVVVFEDGDY